LDQDVRDGGCKARPLGDRTKVSLSLRAGDLHQVSVRQLRRLGEHGAGDRDLVMASEAADDAIGGIADGREFLTKFGKRAGLDLPDQ